MTPQGPMCSCFFPSAPFPGLPRHVGPCTSGSPDKPGNHLAKGRHQRNERVTTKHKPTTSNFSRAKYPSMSPVLCFCLLYLHLRCCASVFAASSGWLQSLLSSPMARNTSTPSLLLPVLSPKGGVLREEPGRSLIYDTCI